MTPLASPASLKQVLSAREAAAALAHGFRRAGVAAEELPLADGGEGTAEVLGAEVVRVERVHDAFGRERAAPVRALPDGTIVVESADAIPLDPARLDVRAASSRGLGELIASVGECPRLLVCLGGTATMDAGDGLLEVVDSLPAPTTVLYDTRATLAEAPRLFGPQKGALLDDVTELEARFADHHQSFAKLPGAGAAGGLGAALASLGAELLPGAAHVLEAIGFRERAAGAELVVTGEGTVDLTTFEGKAPGEAVRICAELGVRCVLFGGRVEDGVEALPLSGDPSRAALDLEELGSRLGLGRA
ncbi:MAG TPA: glycerate kinase [Gaiellaceae bacterium]|nr:glycerate kinase [Gaiellaceae bacterium]